MINQGSKAEYSQKYLMQGNELQFVNNLIYPAGGRELGKQRKLSKKSCPPFFWRIGGTGGI